MILWLQDKQEMINPTGQPVIYKLNLPIISLSNLNKHSTFSIQSIILVCKF